MTHQHDRFLPRVLLQDLAEICKAGLRAQSRIGLHFAFVTKLIAHEGRGLCAAFQRAGDDHIDLDVERRQSPSDIAALLDPLFVEGSLLIFFGIDEMLAGAGVA